MADDTLSYDQTAATLGIRYPHLMRLLRNGNLETTIDGRVPIESIERYKNQNRPPQGCVGSEDVASQLGINRDHVPLLVREGLLKGVQLPNRVGGVWVHSKNIADVDMIEVAKLGIKIPPPPGWVSSAEARRRLGINRSSLRSLVRQGIIESLDLSPMNTFYSERSIRKAVA